MTFFTARSFDLQKSVTLLGLLLGLLLGHLSCPPLLVLHLVDGAAPRGGGAWPQLLFTLAVQSCLNEEPSEVPRERLHVPDLESLLIAGSQGPQLSQGLELSPQLCSQRDALLPTRTLQSDLVSSHRSLPPSPLLWGSDFPLGFTKSQWFFNLNRSQTPLMGLLRHSAGPPRSYRFRGLSACSGGKLYISNKLLVRVDAAVQESYFEHLC